MLVAGYAAAIIYGKMMLERGIRRGHDPRLQAAVAALRGLPRAVIYVDRIGYAVATQTAAPEIIAEFNITGFTIIRIRTLIDGLLLRAKPLNLDVLQLFIALMAFLPIVLFGMLRWLRLTLAASVALYVAARQFDWNLSSFPEGRWYFNPFCWQLLFVSGAFFALSGRRHARLIRSMQNMPALRVAALLYLLFALTITSAGRIPELADIVPDPLFRAFRSTTRKISSLIACCTWMAPLSSSPWWRREAGADFAGQPCRHCQVRRRNGWPSSAQACSSFAAHFVLITGPNSLAMQIRQRRRHFGDGLCRLLRVMVQAAGS